MWVRIEDSFFRHPKVLRAGKDGKLLFVVALCHCVEQMTDGRIEKSSVPMLVAMADVKQSAVKALIEAGLWEDHGDHYQVHDYLDFQPSRASTEAERKRGRERAAASYDRKRRSPDREDSSGEEQQKAKRIFGPSSGDTDTDTDTDTDIATSSQQQLKPFSGEHPAAAAGSVKPLRAVAAASESANPDLIGLAVAVREAQCEATIRNPARWRSAMRTKITDEFGEQFAAAQAEMPTAEADEIVARVLGVERFHVRAAKRGGAYL